VSAPLPEGRHGLFVFTVWSCPSPDACGLPSVVMFTLSRFTLSWASASPRKDGMCVPSGRPYDCSGSGKPAQPSFPDGHIAWFLGRGQSPPYVNATMHCCPRTLHLYLPHICWTCYIAGRHPACGKDMCRSRTPTEGSNVPYSGRGGTRGSILHIRVYDMDETSRGRSKENTGGGNEARRNGGIALGRTPRTIGLLDLQIHWLSPPFSASGFGGPLVLPIPN